MISEGDLLWTPSEASIARSDLSRYLLWLKTTRGLTFAGYDALWRWSTTEIEAFWQSVWDFFEVRASRPPRCVLSDRSMPGSRWFPGAELNYAEHALRRRDGHFAVLACDETGRDVRLTRLELAALVARVRRGLRELGVGRGDCVAAVLPNCVEALAAFLATASLGATWSSCSPEFGVRSVLDRFQQVEPKLLLAADGYRWAGKQHDRREAVAEIRAGLPSLAATVRVPRLDDGDPWPGATDWQDLLGRPSAELEFEQVPFDHPLWILYSSGTTGLPKPIVHGHGGILLEHLKALSLHGDLGEGDRFFWYTTTGWMMWNYLVSGLLVGATIVLYDGSPAHPDLGVLWDLADRTAITCFGVSAPYLMACRKAGLDPRTTQDLSRLRSIGSTGAPLPPEGFEWVYRAVAEDVQLASISGGTDACTAFVLGCPLLPVHAGEIQCRGLGAAVEAFDPQGRTLVGEVGELVLTQPLPSMPLRFVGDPDGRRLHEAYFGTYSGAWRHGDWIKITERGSCVITGRSDATLNRGGVRMGTSEFYSVIEALPEVADSLVVDAGAPGRESALWLFLVLRAGSGLDDALVARIRGTLRKELSPRHVPDEIRVVAEIPRTINGKKMEIPVKRLLDGVPAAHAVNVDTLANPKSLEPFFALASARSPEV